MRENPRGGKAGHADQEVQSRANRDDAAADRSKHRERKNHVVALPIVGWVILFGYTRFEPINAVLALLGFFSLGVAAVNLLPIEPLDGATAWAIIPESIKRLRGNRGTRPASWKHR